MFCGAAKWASCGSKKGENHQLLNEEQEKKPPPPPPAQHSRCCGLGAFFCMIAALAILASAAAAYYFLSMDEEGTNTTGCTAGQVPCSVDDGVANITLNGQTGWTRDEINALGCVVCSLPADDHEAELNALSAEGSCTEAGVDQLLPCNDSIADPLTYVVCFSQTENLGGEANQIDYKALNSDVCTGGSSVIMNVQDPSEAHDGAWGFTVVEDVDDTD